MSIYDDRATQLLKSTLGELYFKRDVPLGDGRYSRAEHAWRLALERGADPSVLLAPDTPAFYMGAEDARLLACFIDHGVVLNDQKPNKGALRFTTHLLSRWRGQCLVNKTPELIKRVDQNLIDVMKIVLTQPVDLTRLPSGELSFLHCLMWQSPSTDRGAWVMDELINLGAPLCEDTIGDAPYLLDKHPQMVGIVQRHHLRNVLNAELISEMESKPAPVARKI